MRRPRTLLAALAGALVSIACLLSSAALAASTVPGMPNASFAATWTTAGADAQAQLAGAVGKQAVVGSLPAP